MKSACADLAARVHAASRAPARPQPGTLSTRPTLRRQLGQALDGGEQGLVLLAEAEAHLLRPVLWTAVEAAAGDARHAHVAHQVHRELHVVRDAEAADVRH